MGLTEVYKANEDRLMGRNPQDKKKQAKRGRISRHKLYYALELLTVPKVLKDLNTGSKFDSVQRDERKRESTNCRVLRVI